MSILLRKMALSKSVFPDPQNLPIRHDNALRWRPERTVAMYAGLGRILKSIDMSTRRAAARFRKKARYTALKHRIHWSIFADGIEPVRTTSASGICI
jgi:hypothetical protein